MSDDEEIKFTGEKKQGTFWRRVKIIDRGSPVFPEHVEKRGVDSVYGEVSEKEMASIDISVGQTLPIGDYHTAKFNIGVSLPCHFTEIEDCYQTAKEFLKPKYIEFINQILQKRGDFVEGNPIEDVDVDVDKSDVY